MVKDYTRVITHQNYRNAAKLKKYYHRVAKKIYIKPSLFGKNYTERKYTDYIFFNDEFLVTKIAKYVIPVMGGGVFNSSSYNYKGDVERRRNRAAFCIFILVM
ncbi:hypothetical protein R5O24_03590 [Tenacibaculum maritimum]|uniref:hypothetical protein n=1 Tax=Tenacibaculum maritimum TaxID=107401 RepID=UPI0038905E4A